MTFVRPIIKTGLVVCLLAISAIQIISDYEQTLAQTKGYTPK